MTDSKIWGDEPWREEEMIPPKIKKVGKYIVNEEIGSGGFSTVYTCKHEDTGAQCAIKIGNDSVAEEYQRKIGNLQGMMHMDEWNAYKVLDYGRAHANAKGIPRVFETGLVKVSTNEIYPYLVMQLLGRHLGKAATHSSFTKERFVKLAKEMLGTLQFVHGQGLVHRDVKPSNFCEAHARNGEKVAYLLDMGFACESAKPTSDKRGDFVGTPDYASSGALEGFRQGPRDDLESLGYTLLEMWLGDLPWYLTSNDSAECGWTPENLSRMCQKRRRMWADLIQKQEVPDFIVRWVDYCLSLEAVDVPDYEYLYGIIRAIDLDLGGTVSATSGSKRKSTQGRDPSYAQPCKKIRGLEE